eukprot:7529038-Alexandrium_andersonii.AAC.1
MGPAGGAHHDSDGVVDLTATDTERTHAAGGEPGAADAGGGAEASGRREGRDQDVRHMQARFEHALGTAPPARPS